MRADGFLTAVISRVRKGGAVSPQRLRAKKETSDFEKVRGTQGHTPACSRMLPHRFGERKPGPTVHRGDLERGCLGPQGPLRLGALSTGQTSTARTDRNGAPLVPTLLSRPVPLVP